MQEEHDQIDLLISNYLSGEATQEEKDELNRWMAQSPANERLFKESLRIWEKNRPYFSQIEIIADREKIKDQIIKRFSQSGKSVGLNYYLIRIAAMLALPLILGIGWYLDSRQMSNDSQLCEVITPKGQISKCVLSDGTLVWLNASTTLTYNPALKGGTREVNLDGEAYFEVSTNKDKPFIVTTKQVKIKVLGTVFNLKAYSGEDKVEATLEEGSIEFSIDGCPNEPIKVKPGEQVIFDITQKKIIMGKVETYLHMAWKDGKYVFKNADLGTIILELEKLYDVRIHLENDSLRKLHFRGMFEYEQNIFSALETLERTTKIKYRMNGRDIWLQ